MSMTCQELHAQASKLERSMHVLMAGSQSASLSAAEKQLHDLGHAYARSASSGDLCERRVIEDQIPERNALSLPQSSKQSQAELGSQAASAQSNQGSSCSSGFASLNRPQGVVPAVPEPASEQGGINRPAGVVPSVPAGASAPSAAQHAEQAHPSEEPARRIRRDRPVGQQAEYERVDSQGRWSSAAESEEEAQGRQPASDAAPDCGEGAENCSSEGPELQGCQACVRKHQQLELARLDEKGLGDVSIGCKNNEEELQVGPLGSAYCNDLSSSDTHRLQCHCGQRITNQHLAL